ncbi:H(+)/Cl(-) exchange transporter 7 isoform X1 [Octopus sinensis]|uniref:Chloride channel protein n=1 Tax=Octopus sinensis TaxID=2607531 RepID=A0A6P7U6L0_9MOLL|nr:H(+)/Cl(-) exchange transporter 7 isoform X1 [Octopus sinensis]
MNRRRSETAPLLGAYHRRYSASEDERRDRASEGDQYPEIIQEGVENTCLSNLYESLDYDPVENSIYEKELIDRTKWKTIYIGMVRWFVMFSIGVLTGLIACLIDYGVTSAAGFKFYQIKHYFNICNRHNCLGITFLIWIAFNAGFSALGSIATVIFAPVASGSGIPQIKCFLNGVKVPKVVRLKTLVVKVFGVVCAVAGGLAVGKEGPMIHSGAVVAAGISQGRSSSLRFDLNVFEFFRTDTEKRDFVSGGAAAGVAAAFGAPVGGVLFSLEEGASFWNQALTWKIFFCSMMSTFTLNIVRSYIKQHPWELTYPGLINFGKFTFNYYSGQELVIFILMGVVGGLLGSLFNSINHRLTIFRQKYIKTKVCQVLETILVSVITAALSFLIIYYNQNCLPMKEAPAQYNMQFYCADGEYSSTATIILQTPEEMVKSLFHEETTSFKRETLLFICLCYFIMSLWTYGLLIPSGLFIPCFLIGGAWGRLVGLFMRYIFPDMKLADPGKYALIGAAAMLGGVVRMTISLTVIIIEATANISYGLPIMLTIIMAKWVGDCFNEGIYDIHIHLGGVPLLGWQPSDLASSLNANEVMSHPVTVLQRVEQVGRVMDILLHESHNGFPVVDNYDPYAPMHMRNPDESNTFGTYRGMILRTQLLVLLKMKAFNEREDLFHTIRNLHNKDFREEYPRFQPIHKINISSNERKMHIDLTSFMNPGAYTVSDCATYSRIFRLFRALGLRHVTVINAEHQVCGIVTRKDLARFANL